ncbi:MAG: MBL fold metallo-hydrolase [Gammaproteobacteria bacterium]|nr:MBL fold metallo-hydrolase [Gammaproteobacteria bacterium]
MQLQFLGATKTVTGSKYLLTTQNKKFLVDCGLFQGLKELRLRNWNEFVVDPKTIDAVIITHAHLDHSGYLPVLIKKGFSGKIYCTDCTMDLCKLLLCDCGHLLEEEANRANKYGYSKHKPALPLYTYDEACAALKQFVPVEFDQEITLENELNVTFRRAGHILGASSVLLKHQGASILFSGDLGRPHDPCIRPPEPVTQAQYLVVESTYGDRSHALVDPERELGVVINKTAKRGGTLIIPAFAVGRTQNILYYIYSLKKQNLIPDIPVFLDSPMAQNVTEILATHYQEHLPSPEVCAEVCKTAHYVSSVEESKLIDTYNYPKIIISASGMVEGGRVLHHIKYFAGDHRNTILFAGYQAIGTRGATILSGVSEVKMLGGIVKINAEVIALGDVSAHADYAELISWIRKMPTPPKKVFITHGELPAAEALKQRIESTLGWECVVPSYLDNVELEERTNN